MSWTDWTDIDYAGKTAIVTGWGAYDNSQKVAPKLRTGQVTIYDYK